MVSIMSLTKTAEEEEEEKEEDEGKDLDQLSQELMDIVEATRTNGLYESEVWDINETGEQEIEVEVMLPSGGTETFDFEKPEPWTDDFDFVRWADHIAISPADLESAIGRLCHLEKEGGEWGLFVPEEEVSLRERLAKKVDERPFTISMAILLVSSLIEASFVVMESPRSPVVEAAMLTFLFFVLNFMAVSIIINIDEPQ
jgi:hypothetical protein